MKSQNCIKCGHKFTYKEKWVNSLLHNYIPCKLCGTKHKIARINSFIFIILLLIPVLFHPANHAISHVLSFGLYISYCIFLTLLYPFFIRFNSVKSTDEH
ncbi:TIGR04104 family putative zinc finger protein [Aminipila sp.]|uniref:TIGR04104 family putative zinc finger protein n=1 Tax=Aminipila sp. TaxID=2060095 RepID=UPI003FA471DD